MAFLEVNDLKKSFGKTPYAVAETLITHELADFVASDAHSPYMRTPSLADAHEIVSELRSEQYADLLLSINPRKVLNNEKIR